MSLTLFFYQDQILQGAKSAPLPPTHRMVLVRHGRVRVNDKLLSVGEAVYAIEDVCSHDRGALDQGTVDGFEIECPRHGARFDVRNGKVLSLPAVRPIKSFATRAVDGTIEVEVP